MYQNIRSHTMKRYKIGFTQGAFDTLHYGHINLLKSAKEQCDFLIVGVNSDKLIKRYKNKNTIIKTEDRISIVKAIRYADMVVRCDTLDKMKQLKITPFDAVFIGDDWKDSERWKETTRKLKSVGVDVVFLPYTKGISTTLVKEKMRRE